jgi:hypothetical protein
MAEQFLNLEIPLTHDFDFDGDDMALLDPIALMYEMENDLPSSHAFALQGIKTLLRNLIEQNDEQAEAFKAMNLDQINTKLIDYYYFIKSLVGRRYNELLDFFRVLMVDNCTCVYQSYGYAACDSYEFECFQILVDRRGNYIKDMFVSLGTSELFFSSFKEHQDEMQMLAAPTDNIIDILNDDSDTETESDTTTEDDPESELENVSLELSSDDDDSQDLHGIFFLLNEVEEDLPLMSSHARAYCAIKILIENLIHNHDAHTETLEQIDLEQIYSKKKQFYDYFVETGGQGTTQFIISELLKIIMMESCDCIDVSNDGNSSCGCCDGYTVYTYHFEKFEIRITESETRFPEPYTSGWSANVEIFMTQAEIYKAIHDHKDNLLELAGDVESNPGPVFRIKIEEKVKEKRQERDPKVLLQRTLIRAEKKQQKIDTLQRKNERKFKLELQMNTAINVCKAGVYAAANYVAPGIGTTVAGLVEGPKLIHILDTTNVTMDQVREATEHLNVQLPKITDNVLDSSLVANTVITNIGKIVDSIKNKFEKFTTGCSIGPLHFVITIIFVFLAFSFPKLVFGTAMLTFLLYLFQWDQVVIDKITELLKPKMQVQANMGDFTSSIPLIGQICFTLLAFCGTSLIPSTGFYDSLLRRMDLIPKAATGCSKIWETAGTIYQNVEDEFRIFFLGATRESLIKEIGIAKEIRLWTERVNYYYEIPTRNVLAKNVEAVKEVSGLFDKFNYWMHTAAIRKSLSKELEMTLISMRPHLNEIYKLICRSTVHEGGPRKTPLCILFSGTSGRGKSELLQPLVYRLLNARGYMDTEQNEKEIYIRTPETEYYDGYVGQKVVIADDAFQVKDTVGNPSKEFLETIRMINTAPTQVHCADINDKGRFFTSEILIYTTNLDHNFTGFIQSINHPEAAVRRLNANAFRILTKPEFEKIVTINGQQVRRLNPAKLGWSQIRDDIFEQKQLNRTQPFVVPDLDTVRLDIDDDLQTPRDNAIALQLEEDESTQIDYDYCLKCKDVALKYDKTEMSFCPHHYIFEKYDMMTDEQLGIYDYSGMIAEVIKYDSETVLREENKLQFYRDYAKNPLMFQMALEQPELTEAEKLDRKLESARQAWDEAHGNDCTDEEYLTWLSEYPELLEHCLYKRQNFVMQVEPIVLRPEEKTFFSSIKKTWKQIKSKFDQYYGYLETKAQQVWETCNIYPILGICSLVIGIIGVAFMFSSIGAIESGNSFVVESASSSGDLKINQLKKTVVESASSSGDLKINQLKKTVVESASSSGDLKINQLKRNVVESASSSGDIAINRVNKNVVECAIEQPMTIQLPDDTPLNRSVDFSIEGVLDPNSYQAMVNAYSHNQYIMHTDRTLFGNVLFVQGYTFIMNYHYIMLLKEEINNGRLALDTRIFLSSQKGLKIMEFQLEELFTFVRLYRKFSNGQSVEADAILVTLDPVTTKCVNHRKIINLFILNSDVKTLGGKYSGLFPTFNNTLNCTHAVASIKNCVNVQGFFDAHCVQNVASATEIIQYRNFWTYNSCSIAGDCGAPIFLQNQNAVRKLVGIHSAGGNGNGVAQLLTQEMIQDGMKLCPIKLQCQIHIEALKRDVNFDKVSEGSVPFHVGLLVHGKVEEGKHATRSSINKIIPSALIDTFPHTTLPTCLGPRNGIDPMEKGLLKFSKYTPLIDKNLIEVAGNDVANNLRMNPTGCDISHYQRVLTYQEALVGVDGDEFLAPINRSTSLGYPYILDARIKPGKRDAFGENEWTFDTPLAQQIQKDTENLIDDSRNLIQGSVLFVDTLKAERRSIQKVNDVKTRVFCAGPIHFTLAFRQYFLGFAAFLMHNRNYNEISTGTNVYSYDWEVIAKKILSRASTNKTTNVVAGDFSNFDGSLSSQILWYILDMINDWYDDSEENQTIRRGLWLNIVNALHLNHDIVYQCTHSQPSGCPITAILNSIYNSIVVRMVFLLCAKKQEKEANLQNGSLANMHFFNENVSLVTYGDDNLIGILEPILPWFNQITMCEMFVIIGHEYTDESKSGNILPCKDLSECAYLKRKFIFDQTLQRHTAPIELSVILEIPQWTKKGNMADEITLANIDVAMRELSLHDRDTFDHYSRIYQRACFSKGVDYRFQTYSEYRTNVLEIPIIEANQPKAVKIYFSNLKARHLPTCTPSTVRKQLKKRPIHPGFFYIFGDKAILFHHNRIFNTLQQYLVHIHKRCNKLLDLSEICEREHIETLKKTFDFIL